MLENVEIVKKIEPFENYNISTQTLIISTNVNIDCDNFFNNINCVPLSKSPCKNKNKMIVDEDEKLQDGDIVYSQYKTNFKGTHFKKINPKYFLNSVTIIMKIEEKFINIKVSNKGKLQITGCSKYRYSVSILDFFWKLIRLHMGTLWNFKEDDSEKFEAIIIPVMCNINFSIGFQINRNLLHDIINHKTEFTSILEPSDGYVGVNIKIPIKKELMEDILIDKYTISVDEWVVSKTKFIDYIETLSPKEKKKKLSKSYVNTFLVFYSGKVIMSGGISFINREEAYKTFMNIIMNNKDSIKNE